MTDRLDLPIRYREKIEALLREHVPEAEVWAYGSRVNGMSHDASDLDLVLRGPDLTPIPTLQLADLAEAFQLSNIPILVEARDWTRLPESFHSEIKRHYVVLGEWQRVTLGDIVHLQLSSVDKKTKSNEKEVRLCNYTDVYYNSFIHSDLDFMSATATDREIENCALRPNDVIITKDSEKYDDIGVPALVRDNIHNLICGYHLAILRPETQRVDGVYLYYALNNREAQGQFHSYANGVTRFGLRKDDIKRVGILLPPLTVQRDIAHILATLDDKIELNRRMRETLEKIAGALFKSWFVDFDPVRAKMEGRWLPGESLPGLPAELYDLFPDHLVDSELGPIPEGWQIKPLGDIVSLNYGKALRKRDRRGGRVPVYGSNGQIDWHDEQLVDGPGIIVGRKGNPGTVHWSLNRFYPIDTAFYVKPKVGGYGWPYLFYALTSQNLPSIAADSAVPGLNRNLAYMNRMLNPPRRVTSQFDTQVNAINKRCHLLNRQSEVLVTQRDALLPRLLSGELRC